MVSMKLSINSFYSSIKNFRLKGKTVLHGSGKTVSSKLEKSPSDDLFCSGCWLNAVQNRRLPKSNLVKVSLHGYLNGINHYFINCPYPKDIDTQFMLTGLTPHQMIVKTDFEFKQLKPTTKVLNVVRCIGEKPVFASNHKLYQKRLGIKIGDVIDMKEYAYATSDRSYAKNFLTNNRGILYEIEVPAGSRISCKGEIGRLDEVVFPRSSKFECIAKERIKDSDNDYTIIKLRYIKPDESWRNLNTSVQDYAKSL